MAISYSPNPWVIMKVTGKLYSIHDPTERGIHVGKVLPWGQ